MTWWKKTRLNGMYIPDPTPFTTADAVNRRSAGTL